MHFWLLFVFSVAVVANNEHKHAIVTFVSGDSIGYLAGALTLAQSLIEVLSTLHRVVLVTPDVPQSSRENLAVFWEVRQVDPIVCSHRLNNFTITEEAYRLLGDKYRQRMQLFSVTCTKFQAWRLPYERLIFLDADTLVVLPIDHLVHEYTASDLYAAPDTFPPDSFNSGVMVIVPNEASYQELVYLNQHIGSSDGGDQAILNQGFCPHWHVSGNFSSATPRCGRLPWMYNVYAGFYETYRVQQVMNGMQPPAVAHFLSETKPWTTLSYEGQIDETQMPTKIRNDLYGQAQLHVLWREKFYRLQGQEAPKTYPLLSKFLSAS